MRIINIYFVILLFASCKSAEKEPESKIIELPNQVSLSKEQVANAGITTGIAKEEFMSTEIIVNGTVDVPPQNMVSVSFPMGGYLKSTNLLPGMHVSKGQVIARIEDPGLVQLQQDYLVAGSRLLYLEKEYERQKLLHENDVNAAKVFEQSQSDYSAQKIMRKGLSERLRLININPDKLNEETISRSVPIYSPINGFVSAVNVNIGKYVNPSDILFELINPDDIHASLVVFEKDLPAVLPKQKVKVSFVEDPKTEYDCEVLLVTKNVDDNRSALVHCHFETKPKQLIPGMFLSARILVDNFKVITVPDEAVVRYGESSYVFEEKEKNVFRMIPVKTPVRQNGRTAIEGQSENLKDKTLVLTKAYSLLSQLMNVEEE
ncbi:MAG: efflux RND transporter periplasmic adaptor subunit [Chitinophagaceae bacterium]|nr:efflux RND transporter periplasmic adaptor subunit [Chitinophagaceae bacterium]